MVLRELNACFLPLLALPLPQARTVQLQQPGVAAGASLERPDKGGGADQKTLCIGPIFRNDLWERLSCPAACDGASRDFSLRYHQFLVSHTLMAPN